MRYFSPTTRFFYDPTIRADYEAANNWPADAVEVSLEDEAMLREALTAGAGVARDDSGAWIITPHVPTAAELKAAAVAQLTTAQSLATLQIAILTDATDPDIVDVPSDEDVALLVLWKKYRQALRAVNTSANPVIWPEQPERASGTNLTNRGSEL